MFNWLKRTVSSSPPTSTGGPPQAQQVELAEPVQRSPDVQLMGDLTELLKRGNRYLDEGRHLEAANCYREEIARDPLSVSAHVNLGFVLREMGQLDEASQQLEQALKLDPEQMDALFLLGLKMQAEGSLDGALAYLQRCHERHPSFEPVVVPLCNVLQSCGQAKHAESVAREALRTNAQSPALHCALARSLSAQKQLLDALHFYDEAVRLAPSDAGIWHHRGMVLSVLQRLDESRISLERSLKLDPNSAALHNDLGSVLLDMKNFDNALTHFDRALDIRPDFTFALANRAEVLKGLGRYPEAAQTYEKLLAVAPSYDLALGNLLWCKIHVCDWAGHDERVSQVCHAVDQGQYVMDPWTFLVVCDSAPLQLKCARMFALRRYPVAGQPMVRGNSGKLGKIRLAYLSADFHDHATSYLMAELFEKHDRSRFATFGISFGPDSSGAMRDRLSRSFDEFLEVRDKSDMEVAELLRERQIDIAIDLKGYTTDARPGILTFRPAPIQVSYLGYPGTMGADHIDYILADHHVIPPGELSSYSEKVAYLPGSYQVNDSRRRIADITPTRSEAGLPEHGFVFCCFNSNFKITPRVFAIWMDFLHGVEGSVLWLLGDSLATVDNLRREAIQRGIAPDRLVFAPRMKIDEHLARQRLADLFLDTVPCNAHTTASDALWAGLPVLTCTGTSFAGRVASSLLHAVDLDELVAPDLATYRSKALWLATNPKVLGDIRFRLSQQRLDSALFDGGRFVSHLEAAYTTMVQRWTDGLAPAGFSVADQADLRNADGRV